MADTGSAFLQNTSIFDGGINYPCWYMSVMFYAAIIIFLIVKYCSKKAVGIITGVCVLMTYGCIFTYCINLEAFGSVGIFYLPFWQGFCEMLIGVELYWIHQWFCNGIYKKFFKIFSIAEVVASALIICMIFMDGQVDIFLVVCIIALILSITSPYSFYNRISNNFIVNRAIVYEYAIFLNHALIIRVFLKQFKEYFIWPHIIYIVILCVSVYVYSVITTKLVEFLKEKVKNVMVHKG